MFVPYRVDVPSDTRPFINWLIIACLIAVFSLQMIEQQRVSKQLEGQGDLGGPSEETVQKLIDEMIHRRFILNGWKADGLFGYMWLHGGILHLVGNLIFLWVFGNAICSKIGNIFYLPIYVGLGLIAAVSHLLFKGGPAIGASGAINGIVGMFLIFFPENDLTCLWVFWFPMWIRPYVKPITVRSFWVILLWFVVDIWGVLEGRGQIAYFAHIGGFVGGAALAVLLLQLKLVNMEKYEKSLLQLIGREKSDEEETRRDIAPWQQEYVHDRKVSQPQTISLMDKPPEVESKFIPQQLSEKPKEEFIRFICQCGKKIKVPVKYAGKVGRCPICKKGIRVPESSE